MAKPTNKKQYLSLVKQQTNLIETFIATVVYKNTQ